MATNLVPNSDVPEEPDQLQQEISLLRRRLKQLNVWPEAGDQFLALIPHSRWHSPPPTEEDSKWLPHVVEDAVQGVDIGSHYPAFFQKLLTSRSLRRSFLNELQMKINAA